MKKYVILTLTYDLGEYDEEDLGDMDANAWGETFYQADVIVGDMEITGVQYVDREAK